MRVYTAMQTGEHMSQIALTRTQNITQAVKFTLFSAGAGIIQISVFTLLFELIKFPNRLSYFVALVCSVLFNFTVNRAFTFKSAKNVPLAMLMVAAYYVVFTPLSTWWLDPLVTLGINEFVVLIGTMLVNFISEFLYCRFVIYRGAINTNRLGQEEEQRLQAQRIQELET
jgi:putative flippase GtrA